MSRREDDAWFIQERGACPHVIPSERHEDPSTPLGMTDE
jgi:hypothetical protein